MGVVVDGDGEGGLGRGFEGGGMDVGNVEDLKRGVGEVGLEVEVEEVGKMGFEVENMDVGNVDALARGFEVDVEVGT